MSEPSVDPRVTVVVVTFNSADVIADCLGSIELHAPDAPAIVVDNASEDESAEVARRTGIVTVMRSDTNEGFARANNRGLTLVETEFALILNPDARLTSSTIPELIAAADRHPTGAAFGPRTVHSDGQPQVSFGPDLSLSSEYRQRKLVKGVKAGDPKALEEWRHASEKEHEVDWVSGSCVLLRMEPLRAVGLFDERYFLYEEDADLCLRLRKTGASVWFAPSAVVVHELGTSMEKTAERARKAYNESHRLYYRLHRSAFDRLILSLVIAVQRVRT